MDLFEAARKGDCKLTDQLINAGDDVYSVDSQGLWPIHYAILRKNRSLVKLYIDKGFYIEEKSVVCKNIIFYALHNRRTKIAEYLLHKVENVSIRDNNENTYLHFASKYEGMSIIIRLLLKKGASPYALNNNDETPFTYALAHQTLSVIKLFIRRCPDVVHHITRQNSTLHFCRSVEVAKLLVLHGVPVNFRGHNRATPIFTAIGIRNKELVEYYISQGADINAEDDQGRTILHCVQVFYFQTPQDDRYETSLWLLSLGSGLLLDSQHDIQSMLIFSIIHNSQKFAVYIIKENANFFRQNPQNHLTACSYAAFAGRSLVLSALLEFDIDIDVEIPESMYPHYHLGYDNVSDKRLIVCALTNACDYKTVELLLNKGSTIYPAMLKVDNRYIYDNLNETQQLLATALDNKEKNALTLQQLCFLYCVDNCIDINPVDKYIREPLFEWISKYSGYWFYIRKIQLMLENTSLKSFLSITNKKPRTD